MGTDDSRTEGPRRRRWGPTAKTVVVVVLLALFGIAFYTLRIVLVPLIIGMVAAAVLYPITHRISTLTRLSHGLATMLFYLIIVGLVVPIVVLLGPGVAERILLAQEQVLGLIRDLDQVGTGTFEFMGFVVIVADLVGEITSFLTSLVTSAATGSIGFIMGAARTGLVTVITAVVGFYLTRDAPKIVAWVIGLAPPEYRADFRDLLTEIYKVWSSFFRGQLILCLTVGVILGTVSAVLGLPQPILLGIWGGLLEFLPSIGNMIWGVTALLLAIFRGSTYLALPPVAFVLLVLGVYIVFTQLDMNVLIPNIIGGSIRLHPIVVLLGVIVGIEIGGVLGVALAAPTIASLRVVARYIYAMLFDLEPFPGASRAKMASPSGDGGQE